MDADQSFTITSPLKVFTGTQNWNCQRQCYCHHVLEPFKELETYNELRQEGLFFDVGNSIQAHKVVMGSLSEDIVPELHNIQGSVLESLIQFAYTGYLDVERTNIGSILEIASQYDIHPLRKFLAHYLITNLTLDNAFDTFNMALNHLCQRHILTIKDFILHNFHALQSSKGFEDLSSETLEDLVRHWLDLVRHENPTF